MRVGVDGTLIRKRGKGVSRFLLSFLQSFASKEWPGIELTVFLDKRADLPFLPQGRNIFYKPVTVPKQLVWDLVGFDRCLRATKADLAFTLSDRIRTQEKYLVYLFEIPDYRLLMNRRTASLYQRLSDYATRRLFPRTLERAWSIITSSQATKKDLVIRYGIPDPRISVVYPAPDPAFSLCTDPGKRRATCLKYNAEGGYLLHFSSNNDPRDNTGVLLQAFSRSLPRMDQSVKLLIGGVDSLNAFGWNEVLDRSGLRSKVTFVGFKIGKDLVELYQAARVYVDPSLYEGFGFQVAEAMACGTPVICSKVTSLPEVVGEAAIQVDPTDVEGLAEAIISVLTSPALAEEMSRKGLKEVQKFSWDKTTAHLVQLMRSVATG